MSDDLGLIIDDETDVPGGLGRGLIPRNYDDIPHGALPYAAPMDVEIIPRTEWKDRIRQREKDRAALRMLCADAGLTPKDQGQTNSCWANGALHTVEIWRLIQNQPLVRLSAASISGPITNYRDVGGWGAQAVEYLVKHGAAPESLWPNTAVTARQHNTTAVELSRRQFRIDEWYDVVTTNGMDARERFDRQATMLLLGYPCSGAFNWMRHLVTPLDLVVLPNGGYGVFCHNSGYGRDRRGFTTLTEAKGAPDECLCPRSVTASLGV